MRRLTLGLVLTAATLSGAAALAYEICWSRALVVPLGNSADAAALVLAGFMLGIAVGARAFGGIAEKVTSPLLAYAILELSLGVYALGAPAVLAALARLGGSPPALWASLRALAAFVLVCAPGMAMGATLPLLVRAVTGEGARLSQRIGVVYGANTLGAAAGALLAGFWGFATLGVRMTSAVAGAVSVFAALLALAASWLSRTRPRSTEASRASLPAAPDPRHALPSTATRRAAALAAFASGFAMLGCELLWARVLTFVFGHDTYAFASLLAFVLLGLGAGGLLHRAWAGRDQARLLAALLASFGVTVLASFWVASWLVIRFGRDPFALEASGRLAASLHLELYRELAYTPLLVLVPSLLAGAIYPTACSSFAGGAPDVARRTGAIGLANGAGSALGAVCGAVLLVPAAGIQGGFVAMALLAAGGAAVVVIASAGGSRPGTRAARALAPVLAVAALVVLLPAGLPRRMLLATVGPRHQTLLHYDEGRIATVSVIQNQIHGEKQLLVNGVQEVTTRLVHDQSFKLLGHLAPLLHPGPRHGLMICLGAGLSAGAALRHPLERLDIVDLSRAVAGGARHFSVENNGVLDDPRLRLHIDDGRQFLLNRSERYDVVMIDSTHPKSVDSWILYTEEFYRLLEGRLADGGIAVQWLPLHGMSEREFKVVVRTFKTAFPEMTLWANVGFETYGHVAYAKLVGAKGGRLSIDVDRLARALEDPRVRDDLAPFGMASVEEILASFVGGPESIETWTHGLPVQTDDRPILPHTTALSAGRRMEPSLLLASRASIAPLLRGKRASDPDAQRALEVAREAEGLTLAGMLPRAIARHPDSTKLPLFAEQTRTTLPYYQALAARYPDDPDTLFEVGTQLSALGHPHEARAALEAAVARRPTDFRARVNLALSLADAGERDRAIELLVRLRSERPQASVVHHNLGALVLEDDPGAAAVHLREALARGGGSPGLQLSLAQAHLAEGAAARAQEELESLVADQPWVAEAHELLGVAALRNGQRREAVGHLARAVAIHPYRARAHHRLGVALHHAGELAAAADAYRASLAIEPNAAPVLDALGLVRAAQGNFEQATELHLQALEVDPRSAETAYHLGLSLRGQEKRREAIGAFCLALALEPNLDAARKDLAAMGPAGDNEHVCQ